MGPGRHRHRHRTATCNGLSSAQLAAVFRQWRRVNTEPGCFRRLPDSPPAGCFSALPSRHRRRRRPRGLLSLMAWEWTALARGSHRPAAPAADNRHRAGRSAGKRHGHNEPHPCRHRTAVFLASHRMIRRSKHQHGSPRSGRLGAAAHGVRRLHRLWAYCDPWRGRHPAAPFPEPSSYAVCAGILYMLVGWGITRAVRRIVTTGPALNPCNRSSQESRRAAGTVVALAAWQP